MKRSFKAYVAALIILAPMVSSCAEVRDPIAGNTAQHQDGLIGDLLGGVFNLLGSILSGPDANGADASAWIGSAGGTVSTAAYTLVVPANAVSTSTRFDIEPTNTGTYSLELHAYRRGLLGLIDVGGNGFSRPVTLKVSYANARGVTSASDLVIIYIKSNGVEIQPSLIDTGAKTVASPLSHFSKYAMAQN